MELEMPVMPAGAEGFSVPFALWWEGVGIVALAGTKATGRHLTHKGAGVYRYRFLPEGGGPAHCVYIGEGERIRRRPRQHQVRHEEHTCGPLRRCAGFWLSNALANDWVVEVDLAVAMLTPTDGGTPQVFRTDTRLARLAVEGLAVAEAVNDDLREGPWVVNFEKILRWPNPPVEDFAIPLPWADAG